MNLRSLPSVPIEQEGGFTGASVVYFITGADYVPLYIGESSCLKYRWSSHPKKQAAIALGADRMLWVRIKPKRRIRIEKWLIGLFQPVLNTAGTPRDRRLKVNRKRRPTTPTTPADPGATDPR